MSKQADLQTDTHLSKGYNELLQREIARVSDCSFTIEADPCFDDNTLVELQVYKAALMQLFKRCFFLFENLKLDDKQYTKVLMDLMFEVRQQINNIKLDNRYRQPMYLEQAIDKCNYAEMIMMDGLHQRNMLVRMSESEPKGARSIEYWSKKASFKKGELTYKKNGDETYV